MSTTSTTAPASVALERFRAVRAATDWIAEPVSAEDATVQSMPDASPLKWHLAHTTWFFETFVLEPHVVGYAPFRTGFRELFNSYYNGVGAQHPRPERGLITRPGLDEVRAYRAHVDAASARALEDGLSEGVLDILDVGLNHEQQHQELMLMDLKHLLSRNPLDPVYRERGAAAAEEAGALGGTDAADADGWLPFEGGLVEVGHEGEGFCFDNETPRHRALIHPFEIAARPVTNGAFLEFVESGAYDDPLLWLADGWAAVQREGWRAPLYWDRRDGEWTVFTLAGRRPLDLAEPVCHVSYYEAQAYAAWRDARLPTEQEWEVAATAHAAPGRDLSEARLHPGPPVAGAPHGFLGDVWEWTASAYQPYPGFRPLPGALGEYNGKFMCNQQVMRGGCCVTPAGHVRVTYRNFFYPSMRWQFGGIRLSRDL